MSRAPAAYVGQPSLISKATLLPIGLLIPLVGCFIWVGKIQTRVEKTEERVDRIAGRVVGRLDTQSEQLNKVDARTQAIDAKLSAFIDFYQGQFRPRK